MTELKRKHDRYKELHKELMEDAMFTTVDDTDPRWAEFNELTVFFQSLRRKPFQFVEGLDFNPPEQPIAPRPEDNAYTRVEMEIQYTSIDDHKPLIKTVHKRFNGLLLLHEIIPWADAQFTSQVEHITVKSINVYLGGTPSKCTIKVR